MVALLLLACHAPATPARTEPLRDDTGSVHSGPLDTGTPPSWAITVSGSQIGDPFGSSPAVFTVETSFLPAGATITVEVLDASRNLVRTLDDDTWDLTDDDGVPVATGDYIVHAEVHGVDGTLLASDDEPFYAVHLGLLQGRLGGDGRIPLLWHLAYGPGGYWDDGGDAITFQLDEVVADGVPTEVPAPWDDLDVPPDSVNGANLPAAYRYDARPTLELTVGGDAAGAPHALSAEIDGWDLVSGTATPGDTLVFQARIPVADGPKVVDETLTVRFTADGEELSVEQLPLRLYALMGPPGFDQQGAPYLPWLAVIDPVLRALDGVEPDPDAVLSALVDYIYNDQGLVYDTTYGASAYTWYTSGFNGAHFDLTNFLSRTNGSIVNCSDCASILTTFADMVGVPLDYAIISPSFALAYIKAIGTSTYTSCPFGPGGCGFSYHAVTTSDGAATIYDATLELDGDEDPDTLPATELPVDGIPGDEYLDRLVQSGSPGYGHIQGTAIR